jgi:COP9 signalosome complex subunit 5
MGRFAGAGGSKKGGGDEGPLSKICRDVGKLSAEQVKGLSSQLVKSLLFNCNPLQQAAADAEAARRAATIAAAEAPAGAPAPVAPAAAAAAAAGGEAPMES